MKWYTAYLHKTEEVLACGTGKQVASALGMTMNSFYCTVSRSRTWKNRKYDFVIEDVKAEDIE